jgi:hypothetical protein
VACVEIAENCKLGGLARITGGRVTQVFDHAVHGFDGAVQIGALKPTGQEGGAPVVGTFDRHAARTHRDIGGQVFVFAAEAIGDPSAHGRPCEPAIAAIHEHQRGFVVRHVGVHRADDAEVVGVFGGMAEKFADFEAGLAVAVKGEGRSQSGAGGAFGFESFEWDRFAVLQLEGWFGVEGVHLGWATVHEEVNDPFGPGSEMGTREGGGIRGGGSGASRIAEKSAEGEAAEAHAAAAEEIAAIEDDVVSCEVVGHGQSMK